MYCTALDQSNRTVRDYSRSFFFTKSDVHVCFFCSEIRVNQIADWMEKQEEVFRLLRMFSLFEETLSVMVFSICIIFILID